MEKKIIHEIKLQKPVVVILAILAIGVFANAIEPALTVNSAKAELSDIFTTLPFKVSLECSGCAN